MYSREVPRMAKRLEVGYVNRSIVCDPSGPQDFFDCMEIFLPRGMKESFREAEAVKDQKDVINFEVIPYLRKIAPEGCTFARNPFYIDCADWGFWRIAMPLPEIQVQSAGIAEIGTAGRWFDPIWAPVISLPNGKTERLCYHKHLKPEAARKCGEKALRLRLKPFQRQAGQGARIQGHITKPLDLAALWELQRIGKVEDIRVHHIERLLRLVHDRLYLIRRVKHKTEEQRLLDRIRLYLHLALLDMEKVDHHGKRWLVVVDDTSHSASEDSLLLPSVLADSAEEACTAAEHRYHTTNKMAGARVLAAWDSECMASLAATMLAETPFFAAVTGSVGSDGTVSSRDLLPEEGGDQDESDE